MEQNSFTRRSFLRGSTAVTASSLLMAAGLPVSFVKADGDEGERMVENYTHNDSTPKAAHSVTATLKLRRKAKGSKPAGEWLTQGTLTNPSEMDCPVINGVRQGVIWEADFNSNCPAGFEWKIEFSG